MSNLIVLRSEPTIELLRSEHADISVISSEAVGSDGMIVLNSGLNWDRFYEDGSPVHLEHRSVRVGRAQWVKTKPERITAKTIYDRAPQAWPTDKAWLGDTVFDAVCRGHLPGKSVTLLRGTERKPTEAEAATGAKVVIDTATVLEFSVCAAPVNPEAIVEEIQRAMKVPDNKELEELAASIELAFKELIAGGSRG